MTSVSNIAIGAHMAGNVAARMKMILPDME